MLLNLAAHQGRLLSWPPVGDGKSFSLLGETIGSHSQSGSGKQW